MSSCLLHGRKRSPFHWLDRLPIIVYCESVHLNDHPYNSDIKWHSAVCRSLNNARARVTLIKAKTDQALCSPFQLSRSLTTVSVLPEPMNLLYLFASFWNREAVLKIFSTQLENQTFCEAVPWTISSFIWICRFIVLPLIFLDLNCLLKFSPKSWIFQWSGT